MAKYEARPLRHLSQIVQEGATLFGPTCAFREKRDGIYQDISYGRLGEETAALSAALSERIPAGANVLILGKNSYRFALSFLSLICGAAVPVPVSADLGKAELATLAERVGAQAILYESDMAKKALSLKLSSAISFDELALLIERGRHLPGTGQETDRALSPAATAAIFFTPGNTTGKPKAVPLSHTNLCTAVCGVAEALHVEGTDVFLSILPLSHVFECVCGMLAPLYRGATVAFGEGVAHILQNLREVHPSCMVTIPRIAQALYRRCWTEITTAKRETEVRRLIAVSDPVRPLSVRKRLKARLLAKERAIFGGCLDRMLILGAPIDAAVQKGLRQLGVLAVQGYGTTECAGIATINTDERYKDGTAGFALPGTLLDLYDRQPDGCGEIRIKGAQVMAGYLDEGTDGHSPLRDGWYYTGDIGRLDGEGFLSVLGRRRNCITTAKGQLISPEGLERLLCQSPLVKDAVVVGLLSEDGRDVQPAAVISPSMTGVTALTGARGDLGNLAYALDEWIAEINATLPDYQHIALYAICEAQIRRDAAGRPDRAGLAKWLASKREAEKQVPKRG